MRDAAQGSARGLSQGSREGGRKHLHEGAHGCEEGSLEPRQPLGRAQRRAAKLAQRGIDVAEGCGRRLPERALQRAAVIAAQVVHLSAACTHDA